MDSVFEQTHSALNNAIKFKSVPKRYVLELVKLFDSEASEFSKGIQNCVLQFLPKFKKEPIAERGLKVVVAAVDELKKKASSFDNEQETRNILRFVVAVMKLMILGLEAKDKNVRLGCVWFLERLVSMNLGDILDIPSYIFSNLIDKCRTLLRDRHNPVRFIAVNLASKLFMEDEILQCIESDPSRDVRRNAVKWVGLTKNSLEVIGNRLLDLDESVRLAASERLHDFNYSNLPLEIRRIVLAQAMRDRSEKVRMNTKAIVVSFFKWFRDSASQEGFKVHQAPLFFATLLEIDTLPESMQKDITKGLKFVCDELMNCQELSDLLEEVIFPTLLEGLKTPTKEPQTKVTSTSMLLMRVAVETLKKTEESTLEKILPDIDTLCQLVSFYQQSGSTVMLQNMILTAHCCDLGEEVCREKLLDTYKLICQELPLALNSENLSEQLQISKSYNKLGKEECFLESSGEILGLVIYLIKHLLKEYESEFCRVMIEIINEVRDPLVVPQEEEYMMVMIEDTQRPPSLLEKKQVLNQKLKSLDDEIEALENEKEALIDRSEYHEALQVKQKMDELLNQANALEEQLESVDTQVKNLLVRSLLLTLEMLRNSKQGEIAAEVSELIQTLIYPALKYSENSIQALAIECLGVFCLLKASFCKEYLYMFKIILEKKQDTMLEYTALKLVMDFFMLFDFLKEDSLEESDEMLVTGDCLLERLLDYLESPDPHIRTLVAEGLCKMIMLERIKNVPPYLARLLMFFFDPESPTPLKQALLMFFTHYSLLTQENAQNLAESFKMVLAAIVQQLDSSGSSLVTFDFSQINLNRIFSFVFLYLDPQYLKSHAKFAYSHENNLHFNLFYFLCKETQKYSDTHQGRIYPRMLCQANLNSFNPAQVCLARKLLYELSKNVKDKTAKNCIFKALEAANKLGDKFSAQLDSEFEVVCEEKYESSLDALDRFIQQLRQNGSETLLTPFKGEPTEEISDDPIEYSADEAPLKRKASNNPSTSNKKLKIYVSN